MRTSLSRMPIPVRCSATVPIFLSFVRPERISSPITSSAAVTIRSLLNARSCQRNHVTVISLHDAVRNACSAASLGRYARHEIRQSPRPRKTHPALQAFSRRCVDLWRRHGDRIVPEYRIDDGTYDARFDGVAFGERQPDG